MGESSGSPRAEELAYGDGGPGWVGRVPYGWRLRIVAVVAVCVGMVVGGYGMHAWTRHRTVSEIDLVASVRQLATFSDNVSVVLRNAGPRPVTVTDMRMNVRGFRTKSGGLDAATRLGTHKSTLASFDLKLDCDQRPARVAVLHLRVSVDGGSDRRVTLQEPLAPSYVQDSLVGAHVSQCASRSHVGVKVHTLNSHITENGRLRVRVRLTPVAQPGGHLPPGLRLKDLQPTDPAVHSLFETTGGGPARLPARGILWTQADDCDRLEAEPQGAFTIGAELDSSDATYTTALQTDVSYVAAVYRYIVAQCVGQ